MSDGTQIMVNIGIGTLIGLAVACVLLMIILFKGLK